ncbi:MAG TPA: hypothetical protein VI094_19310 [Propionibacteriaceae bacterium]
MSVPEPLSALAAAALEAIVRSPSETLVASDFDGTLAPIVDDPERTYADPDAVAALGRLGEHVGAVVVITGRPARMAVRLGRFREVAGLGSMIVLGQYGLTSGKNVWEIRSPGIDKGATLRTIVDESAARQVVFAGDDLGDLPAFRAVRELATQGVAGLLVCSASTEEDALTELSDVIVDGPGGLAVWLNKLADRLGAESR